MENFPDIPGLQFIKELGKGSVANVYLAFEEKLERHVAVKILSRSLAEDEVIGERFLNEVKAGAKLRHSNIVSIYNIGKVWDYYYFSMEYLEGNLRDRLQAAMPDQMPPLEALNILKQIAAAMVNAHEEGLAHLNIKPENIFFRRDGTVVLTDFGLAGFLDKETRFSQTGLSFRSPHYISPEKINGEPLDGRADIYSLGIILFEMLTGHVPYEGPNIIQVSVQHLQQPVPRLPKDLNRYQSLIDAMLAKDKCKRVADARELLRLITLHLGDGPAAREVRKKPRVQRGAFLELLIVVPIVLMALLIFFFTDAAKEEQEEPVETPEVVSRNRESPGELEKEKPTEELAVPIPEEKEAEATFDYKNITRVQMPKCIHRVEPKYPLAALKARIQGKVVIDAVTDVHGNVVRTRIITGHPILARAALEAVKLWRYQPYIINRYPKPVIFTVVLDFRLSDEPATVGGGGGMDLKENIP